MEESRSLFRKLMGRYFLCIVGGIIYAIGLNLFVVPVDVFYGGLTGIAQIIDRLARVFFGWQFNVIGIFLFAVNIPLLYIAYRFMSRNFFFKSLLTIIAETIAFSMIPIPSSPLLDDTLTLSIIGAIICGMGAGLVLRNGGSLGGTDIIGVYASLKNQNMSPGKLSMLLAVAVFFYCFFTYPFEVLVYSIIFSLVMLFVMDKVYTQNIKIGVLVISKSPELWAYINNELQRGATVWRGVGAYSGEETYIIFSVCSKYEVPILRRYLREKDPNSFMVISDQVNVSGNFEKRLFS